MNIQKLAIIFILIILPISIALSAYTELQYDVITTEDKYDEKLVNATRDALMSYQVNAQNESESDLGTLRINLIGAAVSSFYTSLEINLSLKGYDKEVLKEYVPALVFTMYDGYYIYSPYTNITSETGELDVNSSDVSYGVKPYIYYSCRYKNEPKGDDFIITYSLDNYIKINGIINGNVVNDGGYLLSDVEVKNVSGVEKVFYNGVEISKEGPLYEIVGKDETTTPYEEILYPYVKINGTKYYYDSSSDEIFYYLNGTRNTQSVATNSEYLEYKNAGGEKTSANWYYENYIENNNSAYNYYKEAYEFTQRVLVNYNLKYLTPKHAVTYTSNNENKIFDENLENKNSKFNTERERIIRASIETNLATAIANFNNYSGNSSYNYQMPVLEETEWELLYNNESIISFLQGLNLKTRIYNGHTVVVNDEAADLIKEGNIYIIPDGGTSEIYIKNISNTKNYHSILHKDLQYLGGNFVGVLSTEFNTKTMDAGETYYYSRYENACYECIIEQKNLSENYDVDIYSYVDSLSDNLKKAFYTALGRERYGIYRINK